MNSLFRKITNTSLQSRTFNIAMLVFRIVISIQLMVTILAVTLAGYFVMHWNHSLLEKDMSFMYSAAYLLILVLGAGKYFIDHKINRSLIKNL